MGMPEGKRILKNSKQSSGFTLVEILIVLMLLSLMASVTLIYLPTRQKTVELAVLAGDVKLSLIHTRDIALRSHQDAFFRVNFAQGTYWIEGDLEDKVGVHLLPDTVTVEMQTAESETDAGNMAAIRFFPDGSSTGGYIRLLRDKQAYKISVNWLTGKVDIDNEHP